MLIILKSRYQFLMGCALLTFILVSSCIKEDVSNISDNVMMHQSFSVPMGLREVTIDAPSVYDTSSIPGTNGSYYYDGRMYPINVSYFIRTYYLDFNLQDRRAREEWITRLVFHLLIENSFPTAVYSQIYIYSASGVIADSVFEDGPVLVEAAKVNSQGEIEQSSARIFDIPFEGDRLTILKQTFLLVYKGVILSQNGMRLSPNNDVKINTAVQVDVEYNINEL